MLLAPRSEQQGTTLSSVSTLGRIIAWALHTMRHALARRDRLGRPKPRRRPLTPRKPKWINTPPLSCLAVEAIDRVRNGLRCSLLILIDPVSACDLAVALPSKAAHHTQAALQAALQRLPAEHQVRLSAHGRKVEREPAKTLETQRIAR